MAADSGTRPRGRPRDDARQEAILLATADLLAEVGYERLTFEAVANRVGASRATLYRRWSSRQELVAAALAATLDRKAPIPQTGTLRGDLVEILRWYRDELSARKMSQLAGLLHALRTDAGLRAATVDRLIDTRDTTVTGPIVEAAIKRGEASALADPALITRVLTAMLSLQGLVLDAPITDAWIAETVDKVLIPILTS